MEIYYKCYWCPAHAEELNPPIGEFMFDTAVNNGLGYAVKVLQGALGVDRDGVIGPVNLSSKSK